MEPDDASQRPARPEPGPATAASAPISPNCRAQRLSGLAGFTECQTAAAANCKFLFLYGHGRFCTHPLREQIVQQTQQKQRPA